MAESLIGKMCIKLAGRDAGQVGVIVETKGNTALIDGSVRRRKCNLKHLEILEKEVSINKGASHEDVVKALKSVGVAVIERKQKVKKEAPEKKESKVKKAVKKVVKKNSSKKKAKK